jgi:hypothetical protein
MRIRKQNQQCNNSLKEEKYGAVLHSVHLWLKQIN